MNALATPTDVRNALKRIEDVTSLAGELKMEQKLLLRTVVMELNEISEWLARPGQTAALAGYR